MQASSCFSRTLGVKPALWALAVALTGIPAIAQPGANLSNLVIAGDSLSAGYQNSQLIEAGQKAGYANVLATQAGVDLRLPLIPAPGFPQVLAEPGTFVTVTGYLPEVRVDDTQTRDVAVPGYTLEAFVGLPAPCKPSPYDPTLQAPYPIAYMAYEILNPKCTATGATQLAIAAALRPSTAILWIGSNDALFPLLFGGPPTKPTDFAGLYAIAVSTMAHSSKRLVVATIPDVTLLPYLTSIQDLVAALHLPVPPAVAAGMLGLQPGDKVTPYAFQLIQLNGLKLLPDALPDPTSPTGAVPVVIRARQLAAIRQAVVSYNAAIYVGAFFTGATVVDTYSLVNDIARNGVVVGGRRLTTAFMGGLFSLDGVHPTNTGYAVIANEFIKTMNRRMQTGIPPVSIEQVASTDPLLVVPSQSNASQSYVSAGMADSLRAVLSH